MELLSKNFKPRTISTRATMNCAHSNRWNFTCLLPFGFGGVAAAEGCGFCDPDGA